MVFKFQVQLVGLDIERYNFETGFCVLIKLRKSIMDLRFLDLAIVEIIHFMFDQAPRNQGVFVWLD